MDKVRYYTMGKEVTWEHMRKILDRRDAAFGGGNGWVLVDTWGLDIVRRVTMFLR